MQITKHLYLIKFNIPPSGPFNGSIEGYLCYAAMPEEAEEIAQELGKTKAQSKQYLGAERMPQGFVISTRSPRIAPTITFEVEERSEEHAQEPERSCTTTSADCIGVRGDTTRF